VLNVPLAMIGGISALFISGQYLSVPGSIGFIALFGESARGQFYWWMKPEYP
jgi:Cu/Ag efflux pump CusA